ncbi:PH domain-containing protein [Embleya sp. MST-111070]|uniref:PH domain-containing protein n=1 Tax=Embleya sp. MST-111070 TaxID=3398231 RepID=UPI003F73D1C1
MRRAASAASGPEPAPVDASTTETHAIRRYLLPSETCAIAVRRHWAIIIGPLAVTGFGIAFLALLLWYFTSANLIVKYGVWPVGTGLLLWCSGHILTWRNDYFIVTDKRIILATGLIGRRVNMLPLTQVTDMSYRRSPGGRLLGHGTFVMESAGQDQPLREVEFVPRPDAVYLKVCDQLFGPNVD